MGARVVVVAIGAGNAIVAFIIGVSSVICITFIISVMVGESCIVICMVRQWLCGGEGKGK